MKALFETLSNILSENGDVTIVVRKNSDGTLTASTMYRNNAVKDEAKNKIAPLVVTGTPAELDNEFAETIATPLEKSSGLQASMEEHDKSLAEAAAKSKVAAEQKAAESAAKKAAEKAISDAKKLADEKNYDGAAKVLVKALSDAPESMREAIQKLIDQYKAADEPDIFEKAEEENNE